MAKLKDGFYKQTAEDIGSDLYVLLAGGGSKPLSDFATSDGVITDCYWANIKVSASSNDYTTPQFGGVTIYDGTNSCLYLKTTTAGAYAYLAAYNTGGQYGADVVLHSGSAMVLGAGESAASMYTNNVDSLQGSENLYLTADGAVKVFTNCDSIENRKNAATFDADGLFYVYASLNVNGGSDLNLRASSLSDTDPGDLVFTNSSGTELARLWKPSTDNLYVRFGSDDPAKTILHSVNYTDYTVKKDGTGASGTWGINISGTAANADTLGGYDASSYFAYRGWDADPGKDANNATMGSNFSYSNNCPHIGALVTFACRGYDLLLSSCYYSSGQLAFRTRNGDQGFWNSWVDVIHSGNIGSQSVNYATTAGDADTVDGYHAGFSNNQVSVYAPFPTYGDLKAGGFINANYGNSDYGYPDDEFLKGICKWAIAKYHDQGDITLMGIIAPNSSGTCILHLYSSSGKDSTTGLPRWCRGQYLSLGGPSFHFGTVDYVWSYNRFAFTYELKNPADYYWANVPISATSNAATSPTFANATTTELLTVSTGGSHCGIKAGSTYINSISGDLIFQNNGAIRFGGDSWDYNVWAGLKYVHSSKTISLGLADGTHFTANNAQSGGTMQFPGINKFLLNGVVHVNSGSPEQFDDGIRLYGSAKESSWSNINFGCDPSAASGTHTKQWMIGRNNSNNFMIGAGSTYANTQFELTPSGVSTFRNTVNIHAVAPGYYTEGIRLYGSAKNSTYSIIAFGCDPSASDGTHANQWLIGRDDANRFEIRNNSTSLLYVLSSGNVGIGNASPAYKLAVNGTIGSTSNIINTSIFDHTTPTHQCLVINSTTTPSGVSLTLKNSPGIGFHISSVSWASLVYGYGSRFNFINSTADGYASVAASNFIKADSTDDYVLLGGGGHKAESSLSVSYASSAGSAATLSGGSIATWGTLTAANGYTNVCTWDTGGTTGAFSLAGKGGQMSLQLDGFFYQNEGKYLVLDTNNYSSTLDGRYVNTAGDTMTGVLTMNTGTGFQMKYTAGGNDPWMYANGAPNYGIRYFEGNPDKMTLSASGNNDNISKADLCINGNGEGTVTIRGNIIWHAGNDGSGSGLDADKLDGIDSTGFLRQVVVPNNTENDFNTFSNMTLTGRVDPTTGASLKNAPWSGSGPAGGYGVLTYLFNGSGYGTQMAWGYNSNRIYIRPRYYSSGVVWSSTWDSIALLSDINTTNFPGLNKTGTVTSVATGTGLTGGTITTSGTISINSTYLTYISNGNTAYGWGNHADAGYIKSRGYIGTTTVSSSSNAGQNITGIGNITPNTTKVSYLGTSSLYWKEVTSNIFRSYGGSSTWAAFYLNDSGNSVFENSSGGFYITSKSLLSLKAASNLVVLGSGTAAFYPNTTLTLGTSSYRWNYVYANHLNAEGGSFYTDANGAYWTSDFRLKTNIIKARNLDIADLLVEFDWKESNEHSWGYIAQELLEVLPEAVSYNADTDKYAVNYNVAHSAAIASLTARIKELEEKLKKYGIW